MEIRENFIDKNGILYPNIREINNIEKMYLSSVFDEAIKNEG